MLDVNNTTNTALSKHEYGFLVGRHYYKSKTFSIKIPKLMPNVTGPGTETFNRNIFVNAAACKPSVSSTIKVQNYITATRSRQCSLYEKIDNFIDMTVPNGLGVVCQSTNNNYKEITVIDHI